MFREPLPQPGFAAQVARAEIAPEADRSGAPAYLPAAGGFTLPANAEEAAMQNRPHLLLWTDSPGPYIDAIRNAGLADRVAIDTLARARQPSEGQRASTTVLLAAGAPPALLPTMPDLT